MSINQIMQWLLIITRATEWLVHRMLVYDNTMQLSIINVCLKTMSSSITIFYCTVCQIWQMAHNLSVKYVREAAVYISMISMVKQFSKCAKRQVFPI